MPDLQRQVLRRERRRDQIVAAARRIVASEGLEALTIGALEKRLDFTRGVITYHFRGKDEIVEATLDSALREITAALPPRQAGLAPEEKLRAVLRAKIEGFIRHPEAGRVLISFWGRIPTDLRIRAKNARLYGAYRRQTARLIRDGIAAGRFTHVPVGPAAGLVVGLVIGAAMQAYFEPSWIDVEAMTEEAYRMASAYLTSSKQVRRISSSA